MAPAGGGGISIFRISQLFPFPSSFAHPEGLSLGCSLPSWAFFHPDHGPSLASPATKGFCCLSGGCPHPAPLSQAASSCPHRLLCCGNVVLEQQGARMQTLQELQQESWRLPRSVSKCKFSCGVQARHRAAISSVYMSTGMLQTEFPGSLPCCFQQMLN